jgi:thioesterase domain-containing protein
MSVGEFSDRQASAEGGDAPAFPCTLLQERLWEQHAKGNSQGLNVAMRWQVNGSLSHAAAEGAFQVLVRRHEILRTSFRKVGGRLAQVIMPACAFTLREMDLSALSANEREARAEEIAKAEAIEPIDPGQGPLLRATLLRFGLDRGVLLLTLHSLVADGWSTGLLIDQFQAAAEAIDAEAVPDASEPELQFADYALWEKELLASGALDEARAYWQRQLHDAVGTAVPPDRLPAARSGGQSHITSLLLPDALGRAVDAFARQQNVTLYSLAVAALTLMLRRVTGDSEIVMGSQVANREEPAAENLVGPTVNSVTLCLKVDDDARLHAFVGSVANTVQEALQHQRLPFEVASTFAPDSEGTPLHAVNLVVHRSYSGTTETEREGSRRFRLISLPSFSSGTQWPLNFYMIGRDEGWRLSCEADADLYDAETARSLLEAWRRCLEALATPPDGRLADCSAFREIFPRAAAVSELAKPRPAGQLSPIPVHAPSRQVIRFHEGGTSTPMIALNNRSVYYQLARQLGDNRPFVDILLYHQDGPLELRSYAFEDFAAYAVRLIRWAQPTGPYVLGGHCVYGVLAFEAARQLQRMGETVTLVALFDSWAPGYRETMSRWDQMLRQQQLRLSRYAQRLRQYRKGEVGLNEIVRKPVLFHLGLLPPEPGPERQSLPGEWFDDYLYDTVTRYRPDPYDGDAILFRSDEALRGRLFDERMGWAPLVRGTLTKVDIHSGHFDMFRERPAGEIAAFLRATLDDVKGR